MKFRLVENIQDHCSDNKIRWYYDKNTKSWIVQALDKDNNELESSYSGNISDRDFDIDYFRNKYETLDCRKYKVGE